ncbi:hypothetical protein ACWA2B_10080 [Paenibacillus sp. CMM36]
MRPYCEETHEYFVLEMMNAEDVALNGEHANTVKTHHDSLPSPDIIAKDVKRSGFDTFEVTHVKESIKRYGVSDCFEVKSYDIWSEGFVVTGGSGTAHFHGSSTGKDFKEACDRFAQANPEFKKYYSSERLTYWGCRLFDNHADATVSFG